MGVFPNENVADPLFRDSQQQKKCSREGLISLRGCPQRLKPRCSQATCGTAKAVPLTKPDLIGGSLAQCLCESNESLPYRKLVESSKAEDQRIRIRTLQGASIDAKDLNALGRGRLFCLS